MKNLITFTIALILGSLVLADDFTKFKHYKNKSGFQIKYPENLPPKISAGEEEGEKSENFSNPCFDIEDSLSGSCPFLVNYSEKFKDKYSFNRSFNYFSMQRPEIFKPRKFFAVRTSEYDDKKIIKYLFSDSDSKLTTHFKIYCMNTLELFEITVAPYNVQPTVWEKLNGGYNTELHEPYKTMFDSFKCPDPNAKKKKLKAK